MLTDRDKDRLHTIHSACADIQRWVLGAMENGRISGDRRKEIQQHAKLIAEKVKLLGLDQ